MWTTRRESTLASYGCWKNERSGVSVSRHKSWFCQAKQKRVKKNLKGSVAEVCVCVYVHLLPEREGVAAQNIYKWQAKHTKMIPSWDIGARTVMMVWVTCSNGEGVFGVTGHEVALDSVKSHIVSTTGCQGEGEGRGVSWHTSHLGPHLAWSLTGQRWRRGIN